MELEELKTAIDGYQQVASDGFASMKSRIDKLETRANRIGLMGGTGDKNETPDQLEHREAFSKWLTRGRGEDELLDLQRKALNIGVDADGGFAVPEQIDRNIEKLLRDISPIRGIARVVPVGTSDFKKLVSTGGTTSGWVSETAARPETNTPAFAEVIPPIGEIFANPAITQRALDDVFFDGEAWLAEEIADEISEQEGGAFVGGDGIDKPKGFLTYTTAAEADAVRAFGTLQHVPTGVSGAWPAADADTADLLIDLVHSLRAPYRQGAVWTMNSSTLAGIRKLKDANGQFIWQQSLLDGQPGMLLGYRVVEAEAMPDVAADSLSVAFGNFDRGYIIVDRMGTRVLRDPFTNKPYVHFYTTKRVGGGVVNSQAIKFLKFSTI